MEKINKIVEALAVLNTDKREESISSIIKYTLFSLREPTTLKDLVKFIILEYEIDFAEDEISEVVEDLLYRGILEKNDGNILNSASANEEIHRKQVENKTVYEKGFAQFQNSYKDICNCDVPFEDLKKFYKIFLDYINECFYVYGKSAINFFTPLEKDNDALLYSRTKILNNALNRISDLDHKKYFEKYIKIFPSLLTEDEELFLEKLADKTEYFFALGLPKELFEEIQSINPINLDLFLDTNVLLSVLNLRKHTSNEACIKLIELIQKNKDTLNISIHYTNQTFNELKRTKNELEDLVTKVELDTKIAEAGIISNRLDSYTSSYYEEFIKYGSSVQHPTEKLKRAIEILSSKGIKIDRSNYNEILESEHFKDELSSYNQFQRIKNEAREEKGLPIREKDIFKIEHDILIREVILEKRRSLDSGAVNDLMANKYYGLTLDKILIDFDRYSLKKRYLNTEAFVPTFFLPTYLLKKLYKFLPLQSNDYRKAFIAAVSSPVFENSKSTSKKVQATLKDFHALGISDNHFIIKCLTNDYFLDEINRNREINQNAVKEFVESELHKDYKQAVQEKEDKELALTEIKNANSRLEAEKYHSQEESNKLREKEIYLKQDVENLQKSVYSLKKQLTKIAEVNESHSLQYNLEDKSKLDKLEKEKEDLESKNQKLIKEIIDERVKKRLRNWKVLGVVSLFLSLILLFLFLLAFILQDWKYNYIAQLLDWADSLNGPRQKIIEIILTSLFGIAQYLLIKMFFDRIFNKRKILTKRAEFYQGSLD